MDNHSRWTPPPPGHRILGALTLEQRSKAEMITPNTTSSSLPTPKGTVAIQTHGCKLNQADSEILARQFADAGYAVVDPSESPDIYVVNTCTVTNTADAKARHGLSSAHRANPDALIVATGCYAQRAPQELTKLPGIELVVSNQSKGDLVEAASSLQAKKSASKSPERSPVPQRTRHNVRRTRATIKIQEGCDQICSYCIVPKVRGRERNISPAHIIEQINRYTTEGFKEVVLTGTQLGTYGLNLKGLSLSNLLADILEQTSVPRIRVSSLQPQEITESLLEIWEDRRMCPHFHMPLQSGCDSILKRMRRRYSSSEYAEAVGKVRRSVDGATVTADIIAGFPGETEEDFQQSLSFAATMEFADMHIFPYSVRPGTGAAYLADRIGPSVVKDRVSQLLALAQTQSQRFRLTVLGTIRPVLWESHSMKNGEMTCYGLTDNYLRVHTEDHLPLSNQITDCLIVGIDEDGVKVKVEGLIPRSTP